MAEPGDQLLSVGYVRRAHGVAGEVLIAALTDVPEQRYRAGASFLTDEDPPRRLEASRVRPHKDGLLVSFTEINDRAAAEKLRGVSLLIPRADRRPLGDDEFWPEDLADLPAVDPSGRPLGVVSRVVLGSAQDRLAVTTPSGDSVEVPFVAALVEVDREAERVVIDAPEGLF